MDKKYRLAVIGNESSVLIFRALGVEVYGVDSIEKSLEDLESLVGMHWGDENKTPKYAVIFMEEHYYKSLPDDLLERLAKKSLPAVVPVPSPDSNDKDFAVKRLSRIVERAVGSDILS